jgi:pimeloyl-ACP methyl ester carboxylesterase
METTLRFRSYDGTPLQGTYESGASSSDAVVILVHGITSSRDEFGLFSGLAGHLGREGLPSVRLDYRCHGESELPMEAMTLSGIVNDIESAASIGLSQSGASRAHVVGMSFGGGVSAFWAATTDIAVASVVMLAPVIDYEEDILGQHGAIANGRLTEDAAMLLARQGYLEMDGIRYGSALLNELRFISGVVGLRRLTCDSLIIHGDADSIVPFDSSERFARMHDRCELVNVPGTDHGFAVGDDEDLSSPETKEKHREVFGIVSRFLARTARP